MFNVKKPFSVAVRWHFSREEACARKTGSSKTRLQSVPLHSWVVVLLRFRPLRPQHSLLGEQVGESQVVGQGQQRHHVPRAGTHAHLPPSPYGVGIGPEVAGDLRPRQAGLLLEPLQPLREVAGEAVGDSPVVNALSRRGAGPSAELSDPHLWDRPVRAAGAQHDDGRR